MNTHKKKRIRSILLPILYAAALVAFTAYALLDTFVISRAYATVEQTAGKHAYLTAGSASSDSENDSEDAAAADLGTASASSSEGNSAGTASEGSAAATATDDASESADAEGSGSDSAASSGNNSGSAAAAGSDTDSAAAKGNNSESGSSSAASGGVLTADSYTDEDVTVNISTYRVNDTTVYVADIDLSDISLLRTAFADGTYGRNVTETTSEIAAEVGALIAINGDFYGAQESGYVIRNGVIYRSEAKSADQEDLVIYEDGSVSIINEGDVTAEELLDEGAYNVLSFGPALVVGGESAVSEGEEVGKAMASNPRTAFAVLENGHYAFVVSDGRTSESEGLSLSELADFLVDLGAVTAYNLDGGGSSTMVFAGNVINNPTTNGSKIKERSVSDIIYIG